MTTTNDLIQQTRNYLYSNRRDATNQLSADYTAGATSMSFKYPIEGIQPGTYLSVGLEVFQVMDSNTGGRTATVVGAQSGSTAASHSALTLAYVSPEFTDYAIFRELNNDLDSLSAPNNGLFQVTEKTLTFNAAVQGYDMGDTSANIIDILEVKYKELGPAAMWPLIPRSKYALKRDSDTSVFASGTSLVLYAPGSPGRPVRVTYKTPYAHLVALTDDVTVVSGISTFADDLPTLGAAMRLAGVQEIKRNLTGSQGDTRRPNEVPAGAILNASKWLGGERMRRIQDEASRLLRMYPIRRRTR